MKENPYLTKVGEQLEVTPEGVEYLKGIVTDPYGPVYFFRPEAPPIMVAAAMARLSRNPNDLRVTYLNEFVVRPEEANELIHRVVTDFGDDSVQQLLPVQGALERISNLLTKQIEWGRLGAYLEQSTRYIFFDQKDKNGRYLFYTPPNLSPEIKEIYEFTMNQIFDLYSAMVRKLVEVYRAGGLPSDTDRNAWLRATKAQACDTIRPMLPAATRSTVGFMMSAQALDNRIMELLASDLVEAQEAGKDLLREGKKVTGTFLERTDMPDRGLAIVMYRSETRKNFRAAAALTEDLSSDGIVSSSLVELLDYWPQDELDLVPEMLFSHLDLPLSRIREQVSTWTLERKISVFEKYMGQRLNRRHKPGRAIEKTHYEWQITADYGTFRDLQRHRMVDAWEWQNLSPNYGYDVPTKVANSEVEKDFCKAFDLSRVLYDVMMDAGFSNEAQYSTLLGHKMRYRFLLNARESFHFHEIRTAPQGHPGYRKIVNEMHNKLAEVHPRMASSMKFVNQSEDPELARLAAEMVKQRKLEKLLS